ncbi:MAG: T3SS (YopN, CesT) and YbjN peptide-binding chaperone 1 [Chloroflexaceae bacterium]
MQFDTRTQQDNYQQVNQWMQQIVAQAEGHVTLKTDSNRPRFVLTYGSTLVEVVVHPCTWDMATGPQDDSLIILRGYVTRNTPLQPDLLTFLLRQNTALPLGMFGITANNEIVFSHTIPASTCDSAHELTLCLATVVDTADYFDDEIVARWGGDRAREHSARA